MAGVMRQPGQRARLAAFAALAIGVLVVDQLVKAWISANFAFGQRVDVIGEYVRIAPIQNSGGLFGMFQGQAAVFGLASLVAMAVIVWVELAHGTRSTLLTVALGLLLGGALGNLPDRLVKGYVLDFLDGGVGTWRWYTSNVADVAISVSLVLLVVISLRPSLPGRADDAAPEPPDLTSR